MSHNDELVIKISHALNESKFWNRLEKNVGQIDLDFLEEFAHDLEQFIANNIEDSIL